MAEQRGGDEKSSPFGCDGETIDALRADELGARTSDFLQPSGGVNNSPVDGTDSCNGMLSFAKLEIQNVGTCGKTIDGLCADDDDQSNDSLKRIFSDDVAESCDGLISLANFETLTVDNGGETIDDEFLKAYRKVIDGFDSRVTGIRMRSRREVIGFTPNRGAAPRRIRLHAKSERSSPGSPFWVNHEENQDSGRDANRLDYFGVAPFDVQGNDDVSGIGGDGGGGVGNRQVAVGISSDNDGGRHDHGVLVAESGGGGGVINQVSVKISWLGLFFMTVMVVVTSVVKRAVEIYSNSA